MGHSSRAMLLEEGEEEDDYEVRSEELATEML